MKNLLLLLLCLISQALWAHDHGHDHDDLKQWIIQSENKPVAASFFMFKDGQVYLENAGHEVVHYPLTALTSADQQFVNERYEKILQLNKQIAAAQPVSGTVSTYYSSNKVLLFSLFLLLMAILLLLLSRRSPRYFAATSMLLLVAFLYNFKTNKIQEMLSTDPAFIDAAFTPFKPKVHTFWDNNYFYVESKGIPDHPMMIGITGWQQQVPIPQCYIGSNAWSIPLNPVIAATPVPVNPQHFTRGAIAIAANGVPIFNPYTNTGVDALLDGQLDNWGGHSGRGDDYHYHIAPLQLDAQTPDILPIAFGLDGFAVYGALEPDGTPMAALDANHGHYGANGVYHYHGTTAAPYMIGNMVGQVTEDNTMQIIPQPHANPVRPATTPLQGAVITDHQPNSNNNGYILSYTKNGQTSQVDYSWTPAGVYTFKFIAPNGTSTQSNYNGFVPCLVPSETGEAANGEKLISVFPNPTEGQFSLVLSNKISESEVQDFSIFTLDGKQVFQTKTFKKEMEVDHLSQGVYLIQVQVGGQLFAQKLVIQ